MSTWKKELVTSPELEAHAKHLLSLPVTTLGKDTMFAKSIASKYFQYGGSSPKQAEWLIKLGKQYAAENLNEDGKLKQEVILTEEGPNLSAIWHLFAKAAEHLKKPKIKLKVGDVKIRLSVAGPGSKAPGSINVTSGTYGSDNNIWYGRISNGQFVAAKDLPVDKKMFIIGVLSALAKDPAGMAKVHGTETGNCCFCGLELTDPPSVQAGYGPICAGHYGLPWGGHMPVNGPDIKINVDGTHVKAAMAALQNEAEKLKQLKSNLAFAGQTAKEQPKPKFPFKYHPTTLGQKKKPAGPVHYINPDSAEALNAEFNAKFYPNGLPVDKVEVVVEEPEVKKRKPLF